MHVKVDAVDKAERAGRNGPRGWTIVRFALGAAQIGAATFGLALLVRRGMTNGVIACVLVACVLTSVSVLLFGGRRSRNRPH